MCSEEHFEKGSGLWGNVFKFSLKYIRHGCQNYSLRVQRSTLRKVIFFWDFFQNCFRTLSDNRPDFGRNFSTALPKLRSACPKNFSIFFAVVCHVLFNFGFERKNLSSERKASSVLSILHSKRRRTFWGNFYQKQFFFKWVWILRQNVWNYQRKVSSRVVKTVFYVSSAPFWEWVSYFLKFSKVFELWAIIVRTSS